MTKSASVWKSVVSFKGLKGAGTLHIKSVSPADRLFKLEGEMVLPQ